MLHNPNWDIKKTTTSPDEPWRRLLRTAADVLDRDGHCKHHFHDDDGRHCAVGALEQAAVELNIEQAGVGAHHNASSDAFLTAANCLRDHVGVGNIVAFNDHPEMTGAIVAATLREIAAL